MRAMAYLSVLGFATGLGVIVGARLTPDAMAVVIGVVCGVLASVPTSVFLLLLTRRFLERPPSPAGGSASTPMYPPVVVIQPDGRAVGRSPQMDPWGGPVLEVPPQAPTFTVVGDEEW